MTLHHPEIGMKVRISSGISAMLGTNPEHSYDRERGDTGILVDIKQMVPKAHAPKLYTVEFDPPNFGRAEFLGTEDLEKYVP